MKQKGNDVMIKSGRPVTVEADSNTIDNLHVPLARLINHIKPVVISPSRNATRENNLIPDKFLVRRPHISHKFLKIITNNLPFLAHIKKFLYFCKLFRSAKVAKYSLTTKLLGYFFQKETTISI